MYTIKRTERMIKLKINLYKHFVVRIIDALLYIIHIGTFINYIMVLKTV